MKIVQTTKTDTRQETSDALAAFLAKGGVIEILPSRKIPKTKPSGKTTRAGSAGSCGFSAGFPSRSL